MPPKYAVADYTNLTASQARRELTSVLARPQRVDRMRGPTYSPTEAILCLAAMRQVNHLGFGGRTAQSAPSPVPELAQLFQRTRASILAKMANLDGSRSHGGRSEVAAAAVLLRSGGADLECHYLTILEVARGLGIGESELPDFLGLMRL